MKSDQNLSDTLKVHLSMKVKKILDDGKGILAADEKATSLEDKLLSHGIANTENNRRLFRECLFKTPNIEKYIGGVIVNEETFSQTDDKGVLLIDYLHNRHIEIGVKMDKGLIDFNKNDSLGISLNEKISVGLEDLETRLKDPRFEKASFCKWRSLFSIRIADRERKDLTRCSSCCCCKTKTANTGCCCCSSSCCCKNITDGKNEKGNMNACIVDVNTPTIDCINQNCQVLCKYAMAVQKSGRVPIIEPEINVNGDYTVEEMRIVAKSVYSRLFQVANEMDLFLPGIILKCSFITEGSLCTENDDDIGSINVQTIAECIPRALGGVVFLSGGHPTHQSFDLLKNVHKWNPYKDLLLSFSFCRALTDCVLDKFKNGLTKEKFPEAQEKFLKTIEECFHSNR